MKKFFALLVCLWIGQFGFGQQIEPKAKLFDEGSYTCSENLAERLDALIITAQDEPNSKVYIVFYGGQLLEGKNLSYLSAIKRYLAQKVFDNQFEIIRGENRKKIFMQFWLVPPGANLPKPDKEFVNEGISSSLKFDVSWADINKFGGEWTIYGYSWENWGCDFHVNNKAFANVLLKNPNLTGYIVVFTEFGKGAKRADKVVSFALQDLLRLEIPRERLKTIYRGNRKEPQVELWLVPEGQTLPVIKTKN